VIIDLPLREISHQFQKRQDLHPKEERDQVEERKYLAEM
jgi:hypothetical protein